jgi:hypothetical protein
MARRLTRVEQDGIDDPYVRRESTLGEQLGLRRR